MATAPPDSVYEETWWRWCTDFYFSPSPHYWVEYPFFSRQESRWGASMYVVLIVKLMFPRKSAKASFLHVWLPPIPFSTSKPATILINEEESRHQGFCGADGSYDSFRVSGRVYGETPLPSPIEFCMLPWHTTSSPLPFHLLQVQPVFLK